MRTLEESVGYALGTACGALRHRIERGLRELGLHVGQDKLLLRLWHEEGLSQARLGEGLGCEPPTVTNMIHRMEAAGLVERRGDPQDARVVRVYLTERGRALEGPVRTLWAEVEGRLTDGMEDAERQTLRDLLLRVRQNLR